MRLPSAISHTPKLSECFILYFNLQTKRIGKANRASFGNAKNVAQLLASPIQRECASGANTKVAKQAFGKIELRRLFHRRKRTTIKNVYCETNASSKQRGFCAAKPSERVQFKNQKKKFRMELLSAL